MVAIILAAACAIFYWANGLFDIKNMLLAGAALASITWGLVDAFRPRYGALHYAAGEWVLALGDHESQGTLQVAVDLQHYLLVRFTPLEHLHTIGLQKIKSQWLHLERRHTSTSASAPDEAWIALRRALYAPPVAAPVLVPAPASPAMGKLAEPT